MSEQPTVTILCGGPSAEREVSLVSGRSVYDALKDRMVCELIEFSEAALPPNLDAAKTVVFPALHGTFGEDGQLQKLLDEAGITYAGCDAKASALCMDKAAAKEKAMAAGLRCAGQVLFDQQIEVSEIVAAIGEGVVIKPVGEGSSVGLHIASSAAEIAKALTQCMAGKLWMAEERIMGREFSVGVLDGHAMGVVEIKPKSGVYDLHSKYTAGSTEYLFPAPLPEAVTKTFQEKAAAVFAECSCRDFARVDFMLPDAGGEPVFLEVNTLPGLTPTSLLPKSASCVGYDFQGLLAAMLAPALNRFSQRTIPNG